jgi:tetratricopeptide (TPR) repeat protein
VIRAFIVALALAALTPEQVGEVRARYKQGTALAREGKFEDGAAVFKQILRDHGSNVSHSAKVKLYYAVGFCYLKAGQPLRAKRAVDLCVGLAPESDKVKALAADLKRALTVDEDDPPGPTPTPTATPTASPSPTVVQPRPPSLAEAKAAFQDGEAGYAQVLKLIEQAQEFDKPLADALVRLDVARRGNYRLARTLFLIGGLRMRRAEDADVAEAVKALEESQKLEPDANTLVELGAAYGLVPDSDKEIASFEKALELDPNHAEGHFRAAIAFDKSKRPEAARHTFEHAKSAIRINPQRYKLRFQNMLKNSDVAARVAGLVKKIIGESESDELTEQKVNDYADEFQRMLGSGDPAKKAEEFQKMLKRPEVQKLLDRLPKEQREQILKNKDPGKLLELLLKQGITPPRK